jgi:membrane fusion protein, multidrug efflux system
MLDEGAPEWSEEEVPEPRSDPGVLASADPEMRLREPPSRPFDGRTGRAPQAPVADDAGHKRRFRRRRILLAVGLLGSLVVAAGGYLYWDNARHFETTDDAFIAARQYAIAPKVSGYLSSVPVTDNQHVAAGAVIARIDDRDYRTALAQAVAQLAAAQANIEGIDAEIAVQQAQIEQSQAQVQQAQASLVFAQQQASRFEVLARTGAGSVQNQQQYDSQLHQQQAALKTAQAAQVAAERQVTALRAQRTTAEAQVAQATAQRNQARLNLSYTTVTAAEAGRVVNLSAAVGEYVSAGTDLTMFVPDDIWVTANFKETQLDKMRPGDKVTLSIDAYPERRIRGHVASVQPGSGTAFSLLPAENATGNYVKIVQRVPVKIVMDDPPIDVALGPGMSVDPSVRVASQPSLYERLQGWL